MDLLSGHRDAEVIASHCVKVVNNFTLSAVGANYYRLEMTLEQLVERSVIVTTVLYSVDVSDGLMTTQRLPPWMSSFRQPIDSNSATFRLPASGNLQQTYFPRYVDPRETQHLSTAFRLPSSGNLGATYFPRYVDPRETQHLSTAFRLPSSGNLDTGILADLAQDDDLTTTFRLPSQGDLSP
jgi:hypothetical protein